MVYALPSNGSTNWGTPLNNYILNVVLAQANLAESTITTHQTAPDPHGDRAYALGLVQPITSRTNQPSGYVVLTSGGLVPNNLLPSAGGLSDVYDVSSSTYGGNGIVGVDNTTAIQNALNACALAGGGEVWIPNGTWTISSTLVIGNNTWLHLSPGAKFIRGVNSGTGLRPSVFLANYNTSTVASSITGNILISGGVWDMTNNGSQNDACLPISMANATFVVVEETQFILNTTNAVMRLYGVSEAVIQTCAFVTATPTATPTIPAIVVQAASSTELPSGLQSTMYTNKTCSFITVDKCLIPVPVGGYYVHSGIGASAWNALIGSTAAATHSNINVSTCAVNGTTSGLAIATPATWNTVTLNGNQAIRGFLDSSSSPWQITTNMSGVFDGANNFNLDLNQNYPVQKYATGSLSNFTSETDIPGASVSVVVRKNNSTVIITGIYDMATIDTSAMQGFANWAGSDISNNTYAIYVGDNTSGVQGRQTVSQTWILTGIAAGTYTAKLRASCSNSANGNQLRGGITSGFYGTQIIVDVR